MLVNVTSLRALLKIKCITRKTLVQKGISLSTINNMCGGCKSTAATRGKVAKAINYVLKSGLDERDILALIENRHGMDPASVRAGAPRQAPKQQAEQDGA